MYRRTRPYPEPFVGTNRGAAQQPDAARDEVTGELDAGRDDFARGEIPQRQRAKSSRKNIVTAIDAAKYGPNAIGSVWRLRR